MRSSLKRVALFLALTGGLVMNLASGAQKQKPVIPILSAPILKKAPTIDGVIHEAEWSKAARVEGLGKKGMHLAPRHCVFWVALTNTHLYVAIKSIAPESGLLSRARPRPNADIISAYSDDNVEFWLAPHRAKSSGDRRHFQIIVNDRGAKYDVAWDAFNKQQEQDTNWNIDWKYKNSIQNGWWHIEAAVSLAGLNASKDNLKIPWGFRIVRNFRRSNECAQWGPNKGAYSNIEDAGTVIPATSGIVVRQLTLRDEESGKLQSTYKIINGGKKKQSIRFRSVHQAADSQQTDKNQVISLAPGASEKIVLQASETSGLCRMFVQVSSLDEKDIYFRRSVDFELQKPEQLWTIGADDGQKIIFDIGYYPYHNKLKARLDISALPNKGKVSGATLTVKNKDNGKTLATKKFGAFREDMSEIVCKLPELPDGTYVASVKVDGIGGNSKKPIAKEFVRQHFAWEKNKLGITDKAVPPFTPVTVKDKTVDCVLRSHVMSNTGLWDQVTSEGKTLLNAPMRFEVRAGGKTYTIDETAKLQFNKEKENEVKINSTWKAGPLSVTMRETFEMDGMMKIEMDLTGDGKTPIEQLDLVIPLRDEMMPLMHACPDRHLVAYTGETPSGEGLVWESKKASRSNLPGTFLPYIWLGNERQGVCWFADNDRGWLVDDKQSVITLTREKGQLELRIRFITRPAPITKRDTIVFALQATPVKPMPTKPMHWRRWMISSKAHPKQFCLTILGSCYYWGSWGPCHDVYPRDKDFTIYDLMAETRRTGKPDEAAWKAYLKKFGEDKNKKYRNHIRGGKRMVAARPDAVVPYTNARGTNFHEEFQTFQDEWLLKAYTSRKYDSKKKGIGLSYDVSPVQSYQDYCLYYFDKMFKSGAMDGIYFDCVFLKGNFDIVSGGAYYGDDGVLRPAADLFAMRDHLKRTAILAYQNGRPWYNVSHMTSTQIVPINGWAGVNLSWEHKYGKEDFQDRFSRDYIRVDTIGQQTGCVPTVLGGIGIRGGRNYWLKRTLLGTTIVHEIKDWGHGRYPLFKEIYQHLYDFGYGTDSCTVHNYWEKDFPVTIEGVDAEALLLHKGNEAMIAITNFGEGGHCKLKLDGKKLGLVKGGEFVDLESGKVELNTIPRKPYACAFPLPKHDFRLLHYRPKGKK